MNNPQKKIRLQKFLSQAGICSRRKAEEHILAGDVKINGKIVKEMGISIDPAIEKVEFQGRKINTDQKKIYILLNKPKGYITTCEDTHDRKTILDLIPNGERLFPVGRLDKNTEGLLILTNDGELTYKLTHPKHEITKEYFVVCEGMLSPETQKELEEGVIIDGRKTSPAKIKMLKTDQDQSELRIEIHEGRNRQVRKMFETVQHPVKYLERIRIGQVTINKLARGKYRNLTDQEIEQLLKSKTSTRSSFIQAKITKRQASNSASTEPTNKIFKIKKASC